MYALERLIFLKTGRRLRYCWQQYAVSANRSLLEKVRAGQPRPKHWRVVAVAGPVMTAVGVPASEDKNRLAA